VFPVRYELNSYILFSRNSVFENSGLLQCFLFFVVIGLPGARTLVREEVASPVVEFSRYAATSPFLSTAEEKQEQYVQLSVAQPESKGKGEC
jgi:hypothetical protein